jgi:4-hydroxybenzoate polyprenyltransferase
MTLRAIVVSLRPHQWTKNMLVFAALAFSKHLFEPRPFLRALLAFGLFCGLSGAVYLLNDIVDVDGDRLHPRKSLRPIASGALAIKAAIALAALLAVGCLVGARLLGAAFLGWAGLYLALNLLYSLKLKHVVIVDVLMVSIGFVVRAVAGGEAIGVQISPWLLICTLLLALFLTLSKRRHELTSLSDASGHRKILAEYSPYLLDQMIAVVTPSCITAYAVYTTARETIEKFQTDKLVFTLPFVLYGIFRYLYLVHQKDEGGSPTDILMTDRPLLLAVALWAAIIVLIVYMAPGAPMPLRELR